MSNPWQPNQAQQATLAGIGGWSPQQSPLSAAPANGANTGGQGQQPPLPPLMGGMGQPTGAQPEASGTGQGGFIPFIGGGTGSRPQQPSGPPPGVDPERWQMEQGAEAWKNRQQEMARLKAPFMGGGNNGVVRQPDGSYRVNDGPTLPHEAYWKFGLDASTAGPDGAKPLSEQDMTRFGHRWDGQQTAWDTPGQPPMRTQPGGGPMAEVGGSGWGRMMDEARQPGGQMWEGGTPNFDHFGEARLYRGTGPRAGGSQKMGGWGGLMGGLMGAQLPPALQQMRARPPSRSSAFAEGNPFVGQADDQGMRGRMARMLMGQF